MKVMKMTARDYVSLAAVILIMAAVIVLNKVFADLI